MEKPRIRHIAINVADREKTAEYYKKVFQMEEKYRSPNGTIYLSDGHVDVALISTDKYPPGINHFGFQVNSVRAIEAAAQQIRAGGADAMIVVAGEAFETAVRLEWFRRLGLYAEKPETMRPMHPDTGGFYVGEGAAAMVLESAESAAQRGARPYARYAGGAFAHQAWKQTIPDVRAARLAGVISDVFTKTGVSGESVDLVVPHGAGTQLSDGYEAGCIKQSFARVPMPAVGVSLDLDALAEIA